MPVVPAPCLLSIICDDHLALAGFYSTVCGYPEIEAVRSPIFTALQTPTVAIGFHHRQAFELLEIDDTSCPSGQMHLNLDVGGREDVLAARDTFLAHGATEIKGPFETYYGAYQTVLADPEGNVVRITTTQQALAHTERRTEDG